MSTLVRCCDGEWLFWAELPLRQFTGRGAIILFPLCLFAIKAFNWSSSFFTKIPGMVQDDALWCKMVRDSAIPCNTMQYLAIPCKTMPYHAIPCNIMQYHAIPCNTMQNHAIQCNTMQYHAIPSNTIQYHAIPCIIYNCWWSVPLPCGQYNGHF